MEENVRPFIQHVQGDVFDAPLDYALVHCISGDMRTNAALGHRVVTRSASSPTFPLGTCIAETYADGRTVYHLVVKRQQGSEPLQRALTRLAQHALTHHHTHLAFSRWLGCGVDVQDVQPLVEATLGVAIRQAGGTLRCYHPSAPSDDGEFVVRAVRFVPQGAT